MGGFPFPLSTRVITSYFPLKNGYLNSSLNMLLPAHDNSEEKKICNSNTIEAGHGVTLCGR